MDNRIELFEKILADILQVIMSYDDAFINRLLVQPNLAIKEQIARINDLEIKIYSNDHNPPHFHVTTKNYNINAKFSIETGEFLSGEIDSKNLKRIKVFYNSPKTQIVLNKIWNKRN